MGLSPAFDNFPINPHEHVADVDCCGCLMVRVREDQADILCNEYGAVVRTVAVEAVEAAMLEMAQTRMRTPPAINLPEGGTPAERLDMAFRKVLTVPKEALLKEERKEKRQREKRRAKKAH
jgi:hypothetical protein